MTGKGKADNSPPRLKGRESKSARKLRAGEIITRLDKLYPGTTTALHWKTPFQLLVSTILSAQCTDDRVNKVTPPLFKRWPGPGEMAAVAVEEIEEMVRSTGFFRNKAKSIKGSAQLILDSYDGEVPCSMSELLKLPGVARKTANSLH